MLFQTRVLRKIFYNEEMEKIIIQKATVKDVSTMVRWGKSAKELWGSPDGGWYSENGLQLIIQNKERSISLVAKLNDKLVGMCVTHFFGEWAYCEALFVQKEQRRLGIAKLLIDETIKILKQRGCGMIGTFVEIDNPASINFHEKLGYKKGFQFHYMSRQIE